ncbi:MAG: hypothetical protein LUC22_02935 [Prevotella sp.]|nr:hypothetical protein [Prevotella sp.]
MEKKELRTKAVRWAIAATIVTWGLLSFIIVCGEDNPLHPMSAGRFVMLKVLGGVSLLACMAVAKWCVGHGLFPEVEDE